MVFEHAWLQRSPTPSPRTGARHWHPDDVPVAIRGLLLELTARGSSQRVSAWIITESHLVWARAFPAAAQADERPHAKLAVTIARPVDPEAPWRDALPAILTRLPLAPPDPPADGTPAQQTCRVTAPDPERPASPRPIDPGRLAHIFEHGNTALARAVYLGGPAHCYDPHDEHLPALFARLLSWLPAGEREHPRNGVFVDQSIPPDSSATLDRGMLTLLHYLTGAWFCPAPIWRRQPSFPVHAWQLVLDLSLHLERPLPDLLGDLGAVAAAWDTADDLRRYLLETRVLSHHRIEQCDRRAPRPLFAPREPGAGWQWTRILHYWGRSFLPLDEAELSRLAALLAQRIAVDHLFHLDAPERASLPWRYLRRLLYEALLPHEHVDRLKRAVAHYLPSLPRHAAEVPIG